MSLEELDSHPASDAKQHPHDPAKFDSAPSKTSASFQSLDVPDAPYRPSFIPHSSLLANVSKYIDREESGDEESLKRKEECLGHKENDRPHKKPRKQRRSRPQFDEEVEGAYDTWVPPVNQTGDGRTALNDKFGY